MKNKDPLADDIRLAVLASVVADSLSVVAFQNMVLRRVLHDKGLVSNEEFQDVEGQLRRSQWEKVRSELSASIRADIQKKFAELADGGQIH